MWSSTNNDLIKDILNDALRNNTHVDIYKFDEITYEESYDQYRVDQIVDGGFSTVAAFGAGIVAGILTGFNPWVAEVVTIGSIIYDAANQRNGYPREGVYYEFEVSIGMSVVSGILGPGNQDDNLLINIVMEMY